MGESPFALTYRMEAIIPIEIGMPTIQIDIPNKANVEATTKGIDTTDELREAVVVRIASYQQRLENLHNRWVKRNTFKAGELVLRRVFENTANPSDEKFRANLEGNSRVLCVKKIRRDCCSRMWNAMHLKKYYQ